MIHPDDVLEKAINKLDKVLIIGTNKDGSMHYSTSEPNKERLVFWLEELKTHLIKGVYFE